jgi:two-component system sensor histidine kinase YesM
MLDTNAVELTQGKYNKINNTISMFTLIYEYISSIYIYSEKNNYVISNKENNFYEHFADKTWYPFYLQSDSIYSKTLPRKSREVYPFLLSFIELSYLNAKEKIGAVVINIDIEELGKLIHTTDDQESHNIFLIDEHNNLLYNKNTQLLFPNGMKPDVFAEAARQWNDSGIVKLGGKSYMMTSAKLAYNNWTCVSLIPLQMYEAKISSILRYTVWLLLLFAVLGIIISFLISVRTFQPIRSIIHIIEQQGKEDYGGNSKQAGTGNELHYISGNIVKTAEYRKRMEHELERRTQLLNEAQASALQAQINPHFIGNSLETINWMAIELTDGASNDVSETVGTLSQLIQLSLDMDNRLVPLRIEVEHANLYLRMMDIRYKGMIRVTWDIPEELLNIQVVKLCLQPLLENTIIHGIHPNRKKGEITIAGTITGGLVVIHVSDNGVGMNGELLDALNATLQQNSMRHAEHIGLKNVNQRIQLTFGEAFGLSLASKPGEGTTVIVRLPLGI